MINSLATLQSIAKYNQAVSSPHNAYLQFYYPFDSDTKDVITGNDYTLNNSSYSLVSAKISNGLRLNNNGFTGIYTSPQSSAQYLKYSGFSTSDYTSGISVSLWVKYSTINQWGGILGFASTSGDGTDGNYFFIGNDNASRWWWGFRNSDRYSTGITISTGTWYHLVWTISSSGTRTGYINGSTQSWLTFSTTLPGSTTYAYMLLGLNNQGSYYY